MKILTSGSNLTTTKHAMIFGVCDSTAYQLRSSTTILALATWQCFAFLSCKKEKLSQPFPIFFSQRRNPMNTLVAIAKLNQPFKASMDSIILWHHVKRTKRHFACKVTLSRQQPLLTLVFIEVKNNNLSLFPLLNMTLCLIFFLFLRNFRKRGGDICIILTKIQFLLWFLLFHLW